MSQLVPDPEPAFIDGRPNIYGIFYPQVNGWYIGKNETGVAGYLGSPSAATVKAIRDAHAAVGAAEDREKHVLWSPADATRESCRDQEWVWIARFRAQHDGPVFNQFPTVDWTDHFRWEHDPDTHVDRATNSRWPVVYLKLQARCDANGHCSGGGYGARCGKPWGRQARDVVWCKVIHPDGREQWLLEPTTRGNPYDAFRQHKVAMIRGSTASRPAGTASLGTPASSVPVTPNTLATNVTDRPALNVTRPHRAGPEAALMVTAISTDGRTSTRRATDRSVSGITAPGPCWAVQTRRDALQTATIAWYFATEADARLRADEVNHGDGPRYVREWKASGQRNFDAQVVRATAYLAGASGS